MKDVKITFSRYYIFEQNNGRGFGILRLHGIGSNLATIVDADLDEADAVERVAAYRREERRNDDP